MKSVNGLLSIARKAGYCITGQDNLIGYEKKLYLILLDNKAGNSLCRNIKFFSSERNIPLIFVENLAQMVSIDNCKVVGIKNKALSESIAEYLKGE